MQPILTSLPLYLLPSNILRNRIPSEAGAMEITQIASEDIDWVSLLAGSSIFGHQKSESLAADESSGGGKNGSPKHKRKVRRSKKAIPPKIAFHTKSPDDILDDGYRWRKYGQKAVKNTIHPRSYYRCSNHTCNVKKQIQRLSKDSSIVVTTYEGTHNHPCEMFMDSFAPLLRQLQFLSRI